MGSLQHGALSRNTPVILGALALILLLSPAIVAAEPLLLSACEDPAHFSPARTPDEAFDFAAWEATIFDGARVQGSSLRWHVRPSSPGQTSARLALSRPPHVLPTSISTWLKNPNAHDLALRLEIIDADGARYLSPLVALAEETGWREIAFDLREMTGPADDPHAGLSMPPTRVALVLEGLTLDRPHTVYLDEITASTQMPSLAVTNARCPTSLGPGESLLVRAQVSPAHESREAAIVAELAAPNGGALTCAPATVEQDAQAASIATTLRVPEWLPPGRYEVRLTSSFARLKGDGTGASPLSVVVGGAAPKPTVAAIAAGLSPPAIALGEENYRPLVEELRGALPTALSADTTIVGLPATTDAHPWAWAPPAADPRGAVDFAGLDRRVGAVLDARPDASIVLQIFVDASARWKDDHAEHLQQFDGASLAPAMIVAADRAHPDIFSRAWQQHTEERLRALARHVAEAPWGHRVIGFELQAGDLGAWRPWGASLSLGDEATPLRHQAFLDWLHEHYEDADDLRDGWLGRRRGFGRPGAGFEAVEVPTPLTDAPEPSLYDPASDQPMIDLLHFRAEAAAEAMLAMAAALGEEADEGTLVGACYGHLLSQARANDWSWPHTALTRVLEAGALDFLTGPQMRIDDAAEPSSLGDSIRRAGALYLERAAAGAPAPDDCGALVPAGDAGRLAALPTPAAPSPGGAVIEVIDDLSARYLSGDGALPKELLARPIAGEIAHQTLLLRDLLGPNPPEANVYVFRDLFTIEPEQGRLLGRRTSRDGALLVWVYAPGAVDRYLITGRTMQYLTGIKLTPLHKRGRVMVRPESELLAPFGLPHRVSPLFISADERAEWLGTLTDEGTDRCGFALREYPNCTSVFTVAPPTAQVLRHLARRSGIELASDSPG